MRIAVIADVHADVRALRDALAQAERLHCKQALCVGDTVGYGQHPEETVALLSGRNIPCVRGNHDRWATNPAMAGAQAGLLSDDSLVFLGGLPRVWRKVIDGVRLAMCHGTPTSDMDGIHPGTVTSADVRGLLAATEADVLLVGHTHAPAAIVDVGGGMIVNPGALLREPAVGTDRAAVLYHQRKRAFVEDESASRGTFLVLDLPGKTFTLHLAHDGREIPMPTVRTGVVDRWH
jgi:predicted phosphodiesterase